MREPDDAPAGEPTPQDVRVFDRLLAAGLSVEAVEQHLAAGRVHLDGALITDPYTPAPPGTRLVLMPR